ncbi:hypothetical protein [Actinophytocola algeriensis]|uniref:Uncharacterized protein n=1 Tax=Actinophytocola algeriensis TaxID=1768010 RepID=A0A7W7Q1V4_9PSEU|nr:hypothetical protein [Actinophytocola algeriensis]MBB4905283.1 hypothetical protein [Actinophytocola algeriensis]MBE1473032.1 hypothetical protein [Actinophytocola algeriensis]
MSEAFGTSSKTWPCPVESHGGWNTGAQSSSDASSTPRHGFARGGAGTSPQCQQNVDRPPVEQHLDRTEQVELRGHHTP